MATSALRNYRPLSPQDALILRNLARFHYLVARQVCRLLYSPSSITYVQTRLKLLTEEGFCQRIWLPKRARYGSAPAVYTLARRGINYMAAAGVDVIRRYHPAEQEARSFLFLNHTIALNDFLISAELLGRWAPEFKLARLLHERELKRKPVYVSSDQGRRVPVIPDAWLDFRIQDSFQVCMAVEIDRGTEEQKRWREKVARLLLYADGPYQEAFGTRSLTFAVATTAGYWRLMELMAWTRAELEARREQSQADLFLFAHIEPDTIDPERVFLSPIWRQPFNEEPIALLENSWAS